MTVTLFYLRTGYLVGCRILKWNSCCFYLRNLVSVNKISCQNEWYQLVLRQKYSFIKTTKLYHFFKNELYKLVNFEIINAKFSEYVKNMLSSKTNEIRFFRQPYFSIRKLYTVVTKNVRNFSISHKPPCKCFAELRLNYRS